MSVPKLLLCVSDSDFTGAPVYVNELGRILADRFEVEIVVAHNGSLLTGYELEFDKNRFFTYHDLVAIKKFSKILRREAPSLIWINSFKMATIARLSMLFKSKRIPVIYTVHGLSFVPNRHFRNIVIKITEYILKDRVTFFVFLTRFDKRRFESLINVSKKSVVIPNFSRLQGLDVIRSSVNNFLMPARFDNQKDHVTLLKAWSKIVKEYSHITLTLVGRDTDSLELVRLVQKFNVAKSVRLLGELGDMASVFEESDCLVLSTHYEGMPLAILEGMSYCLPIIASDVSGLSEIVNEEIGVLAKPNSVDSMYSCFKYILDLNKKDFMSLSRNARCRYLELYSEEAFKRNVVDLIEKMKI